MNSFHQQFRSFEVKRQDLEAQRQSGRISEEAFAAAVQSLRIQDAKGFTWQIDPTFGDWVKWDGKTWQVSDPYGDDFAALSRRFDRLTSLHKSKQMDSQAFAAATGHLRTTDRAGKVWGIAPDTGSWVWWDGHAWVPGEHPAQSADGSPVVQPTLFVEFEERYRALVADLQAGQISRPAFDQAVLKLRIADEAGVWWMISSETGGWLKHVNGQWVQAVPPREDVSAAGPVSKFAGSLAQSAKDELKSTVKSLPAMIFRSVLARLFMMAVSWFGGVYLHAYFAGYKNNGIRDDGGPWAPWLYLTGSSHGQSWAFIWGLGGMLLSSLFITLITRGPKEALIGTVTGPFKALGRLKTTGMVGISAMILGAGAAMIISSRFQVNSQANLAMGIGLLFVGAGQPGYYLARFISGVARRMFTPAARDLQKRVPVDFGAAQLAIVGVAPGFYLASRLPNDKLLLAGIVVAVIGAGLIIGTRKKPVDAPTAAALVLCALFGTALALIIDFLFPQRALADDNGRDEFTGDPKDYWKTEGKALTDHSDPAGMAAGAGAAGGGDLTPPKDPDDPPYRYSLCLDSYVMNLTQSCNEDVHAWVVVSGPDPAVCASQEAKLNASIAMGVGGNVADWFSSENFADSGGATCRFYVQVPDDPAARIGPNVAYVSASVSTPNGVLTKKCRISLEVASDYSIVMSEEVRVKANEPGSAYYAMVDCKDPALDGSEQLEKSRSLAPGIKFVLSGDQAAWVGGPGEVEGYLTADGKEIKVDAEVPASDVTMSPPFTVDVDVSCPVPKVGMLSKAGRIVIEPPDWFVEMVVIKDKMVLDFKDAASFKVRLIPLDSGKMELYVNTAGNMLNEHLAISVEGANSQYAVLTEKESDGEFRFFDVTFSEAASGQQVEPYLDIVASAELTGKQVNQKFRINLLGKPSLEANKKTLAIRAGADPVDLTLKVKDGLGLEWELSGDIPNMSEVSFDGDPEREDKETFIVKLVSLVDAEDVKSMKTGKAVFSATAKSDEGEDIVTDPLEVELKLGAAGLSVSPEPIKLPLDPLKEPPTQFRISVLSFDKETGTFKSHPQSVNRESFGDWTEGETPDGPNIFKGAGVDLEFYRVEGTGLQAVSVWKAKHKRQIPSSSQVDVLCELELEGDWGEDADLFKRSLTFLLPVDPAATAAARLKQEQENCRKTLKHLPEGELREKFKAQIENDAKHLGVEGLYHLRKDIWSKAEKALREEAEEWLTCAWYWDAAAETLDWVAYLTDLIVQGMASVLLPFPFDMVFTMAKGMIPDLVNAVYQGRSAIDFMKEWGMGIVNSAGGMVLDIGVGQVADLERNFMKGLKEFRDPRKAALVSGIIFFTAKFTRYQVASKPDGDPYSLKECVYYAMRDLLEEIATLGVGHKTKGMGDGFSYTDWSHYTPADGAPDLSGMPAANVKKMQEIAAKEGVVIYVRPTNASAKALLESGQALPKPPHVKTKTINKADLALGADPANIGKVGYFEPKMPDKTKMSQGEYDAAVKRYNQRMEEWVNNRSELGPGGSNKNAYVGEDGVVYDAKTKKPYTGDHDLYEIRTKDGKPVDPNSAQGKRIIGQMMQNGVQHNPHRNWNYSGESKKVKPPVDPQGKPIIRKKADGTPIQPKSKFETASKIDDDIRDGHQKVTKDGKKGEAIIKFGNDGSVTGAHTQVSDPSLTRPKGASRAATQSARHQQEERDKQKENQR